MKKILTIVALSAISFASFGQGYFNVSLGTKSIWDAFSTANISKLGATINVGLYVATAGSTPSVIGAIGAPAGTNSTTAWSSNPWTSILADANFKQATNGNTGAPIILTTSAGGAISITGTLPITDSIIGNNALYFVAWSSAYANPFLASADNSAVGWSGVFTYAAVSSIGTPPTMATAGFTPFAVEGIAATPEPGTMALAALGGASLLLFRRRK